MSFPSKQKELYESLLQMVEREFRPGYRLPAERELTGRFCVARETLRNALARLENERRILRTPRGTFVLDRRTGALPDEISGEKLIHILLPCPDYSVKVSGIGNRILNSIIRGTLAGAVRCGGRVVTIPVSASNDPNEIDEIQLSSLRKNEIVFFYGNWFSNLYELLVNRGCRLGFVTMENQKIPSEFHENQTEFVCFFRDHLANYLPEVSAHCASLGCRKTFLLTREKFSLTIRGQEFFEADVNQSFPKGGPNQFSCRILPQKTSFEEQCRIVREEYVRKKFDSLIFDSEEEPGSPVSLHELCSLPRELPVYVRGKELLRGGNVYYSHSAFEECFCTMAEHFLRGTPLPQINNFYHIVD